MSGARLATVAGLALACIGLGCAKGARLTLPGDARSAVLGIEAPGAPLRVLLFDLSGSGSRSIELPSAEGTQLELILLPTELGEDGLTAGEATLAKAHLSRGIPAGQVRACAVSGDLADCWRSLPAPSLLRDVRLRCEHGALGCDPDSCGPLLYDDGRGSCVEGGGCANGFLVNPLARGSSVSASQTCVTACPAQTKSDHGPSCVRCWTGTGPACEANCPTSPGSASFHDGGDTHCVPTSTCSAGFKMLADARCAFTGCPPGQHDPGNGGCVSVGCLPGLGLSRGECLPCRSSYDLRDDGTGVCTSFNCAPGFFDAGQCVSSCPACTYDDGDGRCLASLTCPPGAHDGGRLSCLPIGSCEAGYHDGGDGSCYSLNGCAPGHILNGTTCTATVGWRGHLLQAREYYGLVERSDGRLLILGGVTASTPLASVEQFDLESMTSSPAAPLRLPRFAFKMAELAGGWLLAAGWSSVGACNSGRVPVEIYPEQPATSFASPLPFSILSLARLPGGDVLASGNRDIWRLDPRSGEVVHTVQPVDPSGVQGLIALSDGRVSVILSGSDSLSALFFDPLGEHFGLTRSIPELNRFLWGAGVGGARLLLLGNSPNAFGVATLVDPESGTRSVPYPGQYQGPLLSLRDGRALAPSCPNLLLFDPDHLSWTPLPGSSHCPKVTGVIQLRDGRIVVIGGPLGDQVLVLPEPL